MRSTPVGYDLLCGRWIFSCLPVLFPSLADAASDRSLKALVFEDCERAVAGFEALQGGERSEFISYLAKVATMQSHPLAESLFDPGAKSPVPAPIPGNIEGPPDFDPLRAYEPSRELDAKRCALRILALSAPDSFAALADVIPLVNDPTLPEELRDVVASRTWEVVRGSVSQASFTPSRAVIDRLIGQATEDGGWLAAQALIELRGHSVPAIVELLGRALPGRREKLLGLLVRIDGGEGLVIQPLAALLDSADDDLRTRVAQALTKLRGSRAKLTYELGRKLTVLVPEIRATCFAALREVTARPLKDDEQLTNDQALSLLLTLPFIAPEQQTVLAAAMLPLVPPTDEVIDRLLVLSESSEGPVKAYAISLLAPLAEKDPKAKKRIIDALFDPSTEVRREALRAFAPVTLSDSEKWSQILRVVKRLADEKDPAVREMLLGEVVRTIEKTPVTKEAERAVPYLIEALSIRESEPSNGAEVRPADRQPLDSAAARYLVSIGEPSVAPLLKALRKDDPLVRARATWSLGMINPSERDVVRSLIPLLKDPASEVRAAAERALVRAGASARGPLAELVAPKQTTQKKPEPPKPADAVAADSAGRILLRLGDTSERIVQIASASVEKMSCRDRVEQLSMPAAAPIPAPSNAPAQAPAAGSDAPPPAVIVDPLRPYLKRSLIECLRGDVTAAEEALKALVEVAPLEEEELSRLRELLAASVKQEGADAKLRPEVLFLVAPSAKRLGLRAADIIPVIETSLGFGENAVRYRLIGMLNDWGTEAAPVADKLRSIFDQSKADPVLQSRIAATLAVISPDSFDYSSFFAEELDSDGYQAALTALAEVGPALGVPVLLRAFDSVDSQRKMAIVSALGRFNSGALPALEPLLALARSGDVQLRATVAIAAMRIAPDDERSKAVFKKELLGRYGSRLASERYPAESLPVIESLLEGSTSWVEKRLIEEALAKSREPHA